MNHYPMMKWLKRGRAEEAAKSDAKRSRTTETHDFRPHQEEGFGLLRASTFIFGSRQLFSDRGSSFRNVTHLVI